MTTIPGRAATALVVIDVQRDVMAASVGSEAVIANVVTLVDRAHAAGTPVLWVQHSDDGLPRDSDGWQYVDELVPGPDEPLVHKTYGDAFEGTDLEALLAERGIGHLVVAGAQTDMCIRSTIHGAFTRGYDVTLVGDAHTTEDMREWGDFPPPEQVIAHLNAMWDNQRAPGRTAAVVPTADVEL
ncbi:MAG: cysteine hydrolase [Nocardioidaceae bacterium]|nr:cysteine hydrolase [Nocardioidaceae bacterium]MCL2613829.1 cysteine hydrolase [Nocardioidaceae bacterium]